MYTEHKQEFRRFLTESLFKSQLHPQIIMRSSHTVGNCIVHCALSVNLSVPSELLRTYHEIWDENWQRYCQNKKWRF